MTQVFRLQRVKITGVKSLLSCDVEEKYQKRTPVDCLDSLRKPTLETSPRQLKNNLLLCANTCGWEWKLNMQ